MQHVTRCTFRLRLVRFQPPPFICGPTLANQKNTTPQRALHRNHTALCLYVVSRAFVKVVGYGIPAAGDFAIGSAHLGTLKQNTDA